VSAAFSWIKEHGSAWGLRTAFVVTGAYLLLNTIGVRWAPLNLNILIGLNVVALWFFLEVMLNNVKRVDPPRIQPWPAVAKEVRSRIKNGSSIDIACSSTSSFYLELFDQIASCRHIHLRIVMRQALPTDVARLARIKEYASYWSEVANDPTCAVDIRYTPEAIVRLLRVDQTVAIGAYVWNSRQNRIFGHTVPMITSSSGEEQHEEFVTMFEGLFDRIWRDASVDQEKKLP
jgi:hypothetical protein